MEALAQDGARPSVAALRLREASAPVAVHIDGVLDEAVWQQAPVANNFRQREPIEGAPATEETEVRVAYDGSTLYIGVLARDDRPGSDLFIVFDEQRERAAGTSAWDLGSWDLANRGAVVKVTYMARL